MRVKLVAVLGCGCALAAGACHPYGEAILERHGREAPGAPAGVTSAGASGPAGVPKPCPALFSDEALPTFEVELSPSDWSDLRAEYRDAEALQAAGQPIEVYRPLKRFTWAGRSVNGAMIRLRGNPDYWPRQDKMQFQISFNELDPDGRFMGLRKIVLDSAHYNRTYLRDRLAMSMAKDAGLPAPCANHARLVVNGSFYGLYTHLEKVDREFLERSFADPSANLYKRGQELTTNEDEDPDTSRIAAFWEADRVEELASLAQLRQLVRAWALESIFPDADGYWAGGWNFYLYDEPGKGFAYVLWDVDLAFDNLPADTDPLSWHKTNPRFNGRPHVEAVLDDPAWRRAFVEEVRSLRGTMDVAGLQARIDRWSAQVRDAAREDSYAPWTFEEHQRGVQELREFVALRLAFLDAWLACQDAHRDEPDFRGGCP